MPGNILLVSRYGELVPLAARIGSKVWFTDDWYRERGLGEGMVEIVDSLREGLRGTPTVVFDHTGDKTTRLGDLADALRTRNIPVWAGGKVNDLLESNRAFGLSVMQKCGINIPKTVFFNPESGDDPKQVELGNGKRRTWVVKGHLKEAREFVLTVGGRWVLKPYETGPSDLSYVAKDPEDMAHRLAHAEEMSEIPQGQRFLLQQYVKGVEVSTEVFVANGEIVPPFSGTLEVKKAFAGNLGPATGCQTSTVWLYPSLQTRILQQTLGRPEMREWLRSPQGPGGQSFPPYSGPLDLNCIIDEEDRKPLALEWTPRFGYSAIFALMELTQMDMRKAFLELAAGNAPEIPHKPGYGYSIKVMIPPAPFIDSLTDDPEDEPVLERMLDDAKHVRIGGPVESPHVWLTDAQKDEDEVRTAGIHGEVMEITGAGPRIEDARDMAHGLFEDVELADKFARVTDGADRAIRDSIKLATYGYEIPE